MSSFITATQTWVMNRIEEVKDLITRTKSDVRDLVNDLATRENEHHEEFQEQFSTLQDKVVTGHLELQGDAEISGQISASGPATVGGVLSKGPVITTDPRGMEIVGSNGKKTGLSDRTLTLMNDRGKIAHIFLRGDRLFYDYPYDKIYTQYKDNIGCILSFLHRGSTPLRNIVEDIEMQGDDSNRLMKLEEWFNRPAAVPDHPQKEMFGLPVNECFPATGSRCMIPESIFFRTGDNYYIRSLLLLDENGHAKRTLYDFSDYRFQRLLVNFPFIRKSGEETIIPSGSPVTRGAIVDPDETPESSMVTVDHIADFKNGYYEVTDPDAVFQPSLDRGLVPNVVLHLNEFPRDRVSVIKFDVNRI